MIKNININESQSVEINSSAGWLLIYRETFGKDILPDLMPILEAVLTSLFEIFEDMDPENINADGSVNINQPTILNGIISGAFTNTIASLSTLEFATIIRVIWALAKNSDSTVTNNVREWVNQFESFPIDTICVELFGILTDSMISSKNAARLKGIAGKMRQTATSTSTPSSSEPQHEA